MGFACLLSWHWRDSKVSQLNSHDCQKRETGENVYLSFNSTLHVVLFIKLKWSARISDPFRLLPVKSTHFHSNGLTGSNSKHFALDKNWKSFQLDWNYMKHKSCNLETKPMYNCRLSFYLPEWLVNIHDKVHIIFTFKTIFSPTAVRFEYVPKVPWELRLPWLINTSKRKWDFSLVNRYWL